MSACPRSVLEGSGAFGKWFMQGAMGSLKGVGLLTTSSFDLLIKSPDLRSRVLDLEPGETQAALHAVHAPNLPKGSCAQELGAWDCGGSNCNAGSKEANDSSIVENLDP